MPLSLALILLQAPGLVWLQQQPIDVADPTRKDPLLERAQAFKAAKDWAGLADWMETLTPTQRGRNLWDWELALCRAGRWERLEQVCQAVLAQTEAKTGPRPSLERTYLAQALFQQDRFEEAMEAGALNARMTGNPADFTIACYSAERLQDWKALERHADAFLARHPLKGDAKAYRGEALTRQARFAEAEPLLREAVTLAPKLAFAWTNLSCCLNATERFGEAEPFAGNALALEAGNLEALSNRGRARVGLRKYREARMDFAAVLASPARDEAVKADAERNIARIDAYLQGAPKKTKSK